jgi:hypothetical protein
MKAYESLYKLYKTQPLESAFAHFYAINGDYDEPYRIIATQTMDGVAAWQFQQPRFIQKYPSTKFPKLLNYLNYTFKRLLELEQAHPGKHFLFSNNGLWATFNTGLQNIHGSDLLVVFERYKQRPGFAPKPVSDWVFKGCYTPAQKVYRDLFGKDIPEIASYSRDSRDYVFETSYHLERDMFDHLFDRAKERAGLPNASDEVIRNYLRGAIENLVPKICRNYKVAIPVYYVEEQRMQMLLPFESASNPNDISSFLVDRDDHARVYRIKTIFDLDHAYFAARLITRPDKDWLNP